MRGLKTHVIFEQVIKIQSAPKLSIELPCKTRLPLCQVFSTSYQRNQLKSWWFSPKEFYVSILVWIFQTRYLLVFKDRKQRFYHLIITRFLNCFCVFLIISGYIFGIGLISALKKNIYICFFFNTMNLVAMVWVRYFLWDNSSYQFSTKESGSFWTAILMEVSLWQK